MGKKKGDEERYQCAYTKKPTKRAKRYYRDGKFYVNKNAYRAARRAAKQAQEAAAQAN